MTVINVPRASLNKIISTFLLNLTSELMRQRPISPYNIFTGVGFLNDKVNIMN